MWFKKQTKYIPCEDCVRKDEELRQMAATIAELSAQLDKALHPEHNDYTAYLDKAGTEVALNLDKLEIASVERVNFETENEETVVGIVHRGKHGVLGEIKEWHFNISRKAHAELCDKVAKRIS